MARNIVLELAVVLVTCSLHLTAGQELRCPLDIVLAIDRSGSICNNNQSDTNCENVQKVKNFAKKLVADFLAFDDTQISVLSFSSAVNIGQEDFTRDQSALDSFIDEIRSTGTTRTAHAIEDAKSKVYQGSSNRDDAKDIFILVTDGTPNFGGATAEEYLQRTYDAAASLKDDGVMFVVVGVVEASDFNPDIVRNLSSDPKTLGEDYFLPEDFGQLDQELVDVIVGKTCTREATTTPAPDVDCLLDVVLVVDTSGSICDNDNTNTNCENFQQVKNFVNLIAIDLLTDSEIDAKVALITYSDSVQNRTAEFVDDPNAISQGLANAFSRGKTVTKDAINRARTYHRLPEPSQRASAENVVILITDGIPNNGSNPREPYTQATVIEAGLAMADGITMLGVGVQQGSDFSEQLIQEMSTKSPGELVAKKDQDYFITESFAGLNEMLVNQVVARSCERPTAPCRNSADVFIAIDGSDSIHELDFKRMKNFTSSIIEGLPVGQIRLGLDVFSDASDIQWDLTAYTERSAMQDHLNKIKFPRGRTNMSDSIRSIAEKFNSQGRDFVPHVLIIITDGNPSDRDKTMNEAYQAKKQGVHIVLINVGSWTKTYDNMAYVSYPYERNYLPIDDYSDLNSVLRQTLVDIICGNNVFCSPSNPCPSGQNCIEGLNTYICEPEISCPTDIVLALDASGSMNFESFRVQMNFVASLIKKINFGQDEARLGMLTFEDQATNKFLLNDYSFVLDYLNAIETVFPSEGGTNFVDALQKMRTDQFGPFMSSGRDKVGIIITDGRVEDPAELSNMFSEAEQLHDAGISTFAVHIGIRNDTVQLEALSSYPAHPIKVSDFASLESVADRVVSLICNTENECLLPENSCFNGGTPVDKRGGCMCECPPNFSGPHCERKCENRYDIGLVIDTSGSIRRERFHIIKDLLKSFIMQFEVAPDKARFGAISFSDTAKLEFTLDRYSFINELLLGIDLLEYVGGKTNIAAALDMAKDQLFDTAAAGSRFDVDDYILFITDGEDTIDPDRVVPASVDLRTSGVHMMVMGLGDLANSIQITNMASEPLGSMMMMEKSMSVIRDNSTKKAELINHAIHATCNDVDDCANNPCENGGTCQDELHKYYCECASVGQRFFVGPTCSLDCTEPRVDLALVLDLSGSARSVLNLVKTLAKTIVDHVAVGVAQVAAVQFSTDARVMFHLDDYTTKRQVLEAISLSKMNDRTNTAAALRLIRAEIFVSGNGGRVGVAKKVILISGGKSNIEEQNTMAAAETLRDDGVEIFVVGVGDNADMTEANGIASSTSSIHVKKVNTEAEILPVAAAIINSICQN